MKFVYNWLIAIIQKLFSKGGLPAKTEEKKPFEPYFRLNDLQFFASDGDDSDDDGRDSGEDDQDDDQEDDEEDNVPDLDELLKDPAFKKQYNAKLKEQLSKRMKRHNKELERLKGKDKKGDDEGTDDDDQTRINEKRLLRAERREKRAIVKEFAVDNGHNPRLLARLIDLDEIELDEDGEPENLDELFEELEEEFPEYFGPNKDDDDEDDEEEDRPRKKRFTPGARQKMNKKKKVDPREAGRQKALERHKKKEEN